MGLAGYSDGADYLNNLMMKNPLFVFPFFHYICCLKGFRYCGMKRESGASPEHYPML